jgi:hypothetical protein
MNEPFTIEWLGGPAEHHFRKARPEGDFDWESLQASRYPKSLVDASRRVWMGLVLSEYAAINAFADVVAALSQARAPLDLIGMTGDFLADEVRHVELACRVVMQLGGAPVHPFDPSRLSPRTPSATTPFERANELAVRVGCVAEVFAGATAMPIMKETTHPLLRAVYASILRDEARHSRFGSLYFEWAGDRLTDAERVRLGTVTLDALRGFAFLWQPRAPFSDSPPEWQPFTSQDLGWLELPRHVTLARDAVLHDVLPPLRKLGLVFPEAELEALLA